MKNFLEDLDLRSEHSTGPTDGKDGLIQLISIAHPFVVYDDDQSATPSRSKAPAVRIIGGALGPDGAPDDGA